MEVLDLGPRLELAAQAVSSTLGSRAHGAFQSLPVVDVSDLSSPDPVRRRQAAEAFGQATREAGFLYVVGHGVPPALGARLVEQAAAFFALPLERKMSLYIGRSANHRGYVPAGEEVFYGGGVDLKEAFDLALELPADDPVVRAGTPMLGPNVWPDLPGFKGVVQDYYQAVFALGRRLLRGFALALGLREETFEAFVTKPPSQLRLVHYPYDANAGDGAGIAAHTDYECFTILLPTAPGLEVMNGEGAWIDAPPLDGALVVNVGDLLEIWTNGAFVATSHRVRPVREERFSFPLFFCCDYHTEVAPLPAFVGPDRPARYQAVRAGEHLYAQTIQSFKYMQARLSAGEVALPAGARPLSSFGQAARHREGQAE
jgi:isopenicillin N synthase-like dioxygenase